MFSGLLDSSHILFALGLLIGCCVLIKALTSVGQGAGRDVAYAPTPILTANEQRLFSVLRQEFPDLYFFPQVSMGGVMRPDLARRDRRYLPAFRRIAQKRIDFVVCRADLAVICLLELDDASHKREKDVQRDSLTRSAGYTTVRLRTARVIDLTLLRQLVDA